MIAAAALLVGVSVLPNAWMLWQAFRVTVPATDPAGEATVHWGLAHWHTAYAGRTWIWELLWDSVLSGGGTIVVATAIGLPAGWLCFRTDAPGRRVVIAVMVLVAAQPIYLMVTAWMAALGSSWWFTLPEPWQRAMGAAWMQGMVYAPAALLLFGIGLRRVNPDLEDVARMEGAGSWRVFWQVTLPQTWRWLAGGGLLIGLLAFMDITVTDLLRVRSFPEQALWLFQAQGERGPPTAIGLPPLVLVLVLGLAILAWNRRRDVGETPGSHRGPETLHLTRPGQAAAGLFFLGLLGLYAWPLVVLVRRCESVKAFLTVCSANADSQVLSAGVAAASACLATFGGGALAWALLRTPRRWALLGGLGVLGLLLATSAPVTGSGWALLLDRHGWRGEIYDSAYAILILTETSRVLGYACLVLLPALRAVPPDQLAMARVDGATWLQTLHRVLLPNCWRAVIVAWLVCFILALGELGAAMLVVPAGTPPVSVRLATLIHNGIYADVAGLCLFTALVCVLPALLLAGGLSRFLTRRWE